MITDMITVALLAILSIVLLTATIRSVLHDGPARPPRSHASDPAFLPPSERASYDTAA